MMKLAWAPATKNIKVFSLETVAAHPENTRSVCRYCNDSLKADRISYTSFRPFKKVFTRKIDLIKRKRYPKISSALSGRDESLHIWMNARVYNTFCGKRTSPFFSIYIYIYSHESLHIENVYSESLGNSAKLVPVFSIDNAALQTMLLFTRSAHFARSEKGDQLWQTE